MNKKQVDKILNEEVFPLIESESLINMATALEKLNEIDNQNDGYIKFLKGMLLNDLSEKSPHKTYSEAIKELLKANQLIPEHFHIIKQLARAYNGNNLPEEAEIYFDKAGEIINKLNPSISYGKTRHAYSVILSDLQEMIGNDIPPVERGSDDEFFMDKSDYEFFMDWGDFLFKKNEFDEGTQKFEIAFALRPNSNSWEMLHRWAIAIYEWCINRGENLNFLKVAFQLFEMALKQSPNNEHFYMCWASILQSDNYKDYETALKLYEAVTKINPPNELMFLWESVRPLFFLKDWEQQLKVFKKIEKLINESDHMKKIKLNHRCGCAWSHNGENWDALSKENKQYFGNDPNIYKKATSIWPDCCQRTLYFLMGECYFSIENYDSALKNYKKTLNFQCAPAMNSIIDAAVYSHIGKSLIQSNRIEDGIIAFDQSIEKSGVGSNIRLSLIYGDELEKLEKYEKALVVYKQTIITEDYKNTDNYKRAQIHSRIGCCIFKTNNTNHQDTLAGALEELATSNGLYCGLEKDENWDNENRKQREKTLKTMIKVKEKLNISPVDDQSQLSKLQKTVDEINNKINRTEVMPKNDDVIYSISQILQTNPFSEQGVLPKHLLDPDTVTKARKELRRFGETIAKAKKEKDKIEKSLPPENSPTIDKDKYDYYDDASLLFAVVCLRREMERGEHEWCNNNWSNLRQWACFQFKIKGEFHTSKNWADSYNNRNRNKGGNK